MSEIEAMREVFAVQPGAVRCPYDAYATLRDEAPVVFAERLQSYVVTRHRDIVEVLRAPEVFSSRVASGPGAATALARRVANDPSFPADVRRMAERRLRITASPVLITADPPLHSRQRELVNRAFSQRRVAAMEDGICGVVDELVDAFVADGEADIVRQLAVPLPLSVIADTLGVPRADAGSFERWSDAFVVATGNVTLTDDQIVEMLTSMDEFYDYFTDKIAARRVRPTDDLLGAVVAARVDGVEPLTLDEMLGILVLFLVAGNETTTNAIGWATNALLRDPALAERLRRDPSAIAAFVEESLRLEAPVQGLFRTAERDVVVGGASVPAGSHLWLVYGSGNRDEEAFTDADRLDLERVTPRSHLSFGFGEHFCIGASLARAETRIALEAVLSRLDGLHALDADETLVCQPSFVIRGLAQLRVGFTPRIGRR